MQKFHQSTFGLNVIQCLRDSASWVLHLALCRFDACEVA
jgi:hypothetical protein